MSQQKQNEPSRAAMDAAPRVYLVIDQYGNAHEPHFASLKDAEQFAEKMSYPVEVIAYTSDAAMQPEREAANGLKEYILNNTSCDCTPISYRPCNRCKALAAYEAARGK